MEYRKLGNTGLLVSEIGLGCEGIVQAEEEARDKLIQAALAGGVNCLDLFSADPSVHRAVGRNIKGCRDSFVLQAHLCSYWDNNQYRRTRDIVEVKSAFEALMKNLDTPYLDIGMIHYVDSEQEWLGVQNGPVMEYALAQKAAGRIRHIGLSTHNPKVGKLAVESGLVEAMLFSINPCYDLQPAGEDVDLLWADEKYEGQLVNMDPEREALYELCQAKGVGITVMKAFGGGDLLDASMSPAGVALTVNQCIHYALTRPAVASVMSGAKTIEELALSLAYEKAAPEQRDYAAAFATFPKISWKGHCMYCGHCAPCPMGIDVATVTKFLNLVKAQGFLPETVREHYAVLEHKAGDCIECGACEGRCPFTVGVIENMRAAKELFGA